MMVRVVRQLLVFLSIFLSQHANGYDGEDTNCRSPRDGIWKHHDTIFDKEAICSPDGKTRLFFYAPRCQLGIRTGCDNNEENCDVEYLKNPGGSHTGCNSAVLQSRGNAGNIQVQKNSNPVLQLKYKTYGNFGSFTPGSSRNSYNDIATMTIRDDGTFETIVTNKGSDRNFSKVVWKAGSTSDLDGEDTKCRYNNVWNSNTSLENKQAICSPDEKTRIFFYSQTCKLGMRICPSNDTDKNCNVFYLENPDKSPSGCLTATLQARSDAGNIELTRNAATVLQLKDKVNGNFGGAFTPKSSGNSYNDIATMTIKDDGTFETIVTNNGSDRNFSEVVWKAGVKRSGEDTKCVSGNVWDSRNMLEDRQAICSPDKKTRIFFYSEACILGMRTCDGNGKCDEVELQNPGTLPKGCSKATLQGGNDAGNILVIRDGVAVLQLRKKVNGNFGEAFTPYHNRYSNTFATMTVRNDGTFETIVINRNDPNLPKEVWRAGRKWKEPTWAPIQPPSSGYNPYCEDKDDGWCYDKLRNYFTKGQNYCKTRDRVGGKLVVIGDHCPKSCYTGNCNQMAPRKTCYDTPDKLLPDSIASCRNVRKQQCFNRVYDRSNKKYVLLRDFCRFTCGVDEDCEGRPLSDVALRGEKQE